MCPVVPAGKLTRRRWHPTRGREEQTGEEQDPGLFDSLRERGVRKKIAQAASELAAKSKNGKPPKAVTPTIRT
jgi:hypothetical protein